MMQQIAGAVLAAMSAIAFFGVDTTCASASQAETATGRTVIRSGRMLDVTSGLLVANVTILVEGDRIVAVGPDVAVPSDDAAIVVDLSNLTVLPGLIDAHTHVFLLPGHEAVKTNIYESIPFRTIKATVAARTWLENGFTTIRDVDTEGAGFADVAVRDAINEGIVVGPRMQVATRAISVTGAYMDQVGLAPGISIPTPAAIVMTADEIRQEVREQIKYGADLIKFYSTSTMRDIDPETMTPMTLFDEEEHRIAVEEARRYRRYVAVHCYGGEGATHAIRAGVRSIDHGMLLSDEQLQMMASRDVYWVPTMSTYLKGYEEGQPPLELRQKVVEAHKRTFQSALRAGVKIAMGSDVSDGTNARELEIMVSYGMTPLQALQSSTMVAAEMMGWDDRVGSIAVGKYADLVAVAGNPLQDIRLVQDIKFVMKGGQIIVNRTR